MTINEINSVVQALVWTTVAGLLYAVWLRSHSGSTSFRFDTSHIWQPVLQLLQWMWMLLAIGLIISLLVFAWPKISSAQYSYPGCSHTVIAAGGASSACGDSSATTH